MQQHPGIAGLRENHVLGNDAVGTGDVIDARMGGADVIHFAGIAQGVHGGAVRDIIRCHERQRLVAGNRCLCPDDGIVGVA